MQKTDIWVGRRIAEKLGFREFPKDPGGRYFRDWYSGDFEGGYEETEYITCIHTGRSSDVCVVSAKNGDFDFNEKQILESYGKYQRLKKFVVLRNDPEKARRFLDE